LKDKESAVADATSTVRSEVQKEWEADALKFREEMARQFEIQLNEEVQRVKEQCEKELSRRVQGVNELEERVLAIKSKVEQGGQKEATTTNVLKIAGGVMGLVGAMEKRSDAKKASSLQSDISALKKICASETLIVAALENLEADLKKGGALPTTGELQARYETVFETARKMTFLDGSDMTGVLALVRGNIASKLQRPPQAEEAMKKSNAACTDEDLLVRAGHLTKIGSLKEAADELDKIKGKKTRVAIRDWVKDCTTRVDADIACDVMKNRCAVLMSNV